MKLVGLFAVENNLLQRIFLGPQHKKVQKILPKITDFTVDWITDNIYYTNGRGIRITNLNHSMDDLDEELYNAGDRLIWALAVDPVAGSVFSLSIQAYYSLLC